MKLSKKPIQRWRIIGLIIAITGLSLLVAGSLLGWEKIAQRLHGSFTTITVDHSHDEEIFPELPENISPLRRHILQLARQEFETQSAGTKFSEGVVEAWCADFVSWILREAGQPLKNPHSGSWRIPGTFTLREYYESAGRFHAVGSGYTPQPGDVAIYRGSPVFGDHTNIVILYQDGVLTTVGGNEMNRIRVFVNRDKNYQGLLGYGVPVEG